MIGSTGENAERKSKCERYQVIRYDQFGEAGIGGAAGMPDMGDMGGGDDGPSIFKVLGMGFYVFIASYIGNLKYLKEEPVKVSMIGVALIKTLLIFTFFSTKSSITFFAFSSSYFSF